MNTCRIKAFLDNQSGASHNHRVWIGRISKADSIEYFGVDFGASVIRVSEKDGLIQILRKSPHGSIKCKDGIYRSVAFFNSLNPVKSRYETTGKPRQAILQLMAG